MMKSILMIVLFLAVCFILGEVLLGLIMFICKSVSDLYYKGMVFFGCLNGHTWDGCICKKCGESRDFGHVYMRPLSSFPTENHPSECKCGKVCNHPIVLRCQCQVCGHEVHKFEIDDEWWDDKRNLYKIRHRCVNCGKRY